MKTVEQKVEYYHDYVDTWSICLEMRKLINKGWRVHTMVERDRYVIVVYEKPLETWS